jgi:hypothetical protein
MMSFEPPKASALRWLFYIYLCFLGALFTVHHGLI